MKNIGRSKYFTIFELKILFLKPALNDKQSAFCEEYLIDLNATQAAIRAGYSKKTAAQIGEKLLRKVEIQEKIQQLKNERSARTDITADAVIRRLAEISFANVDHFAKVVEQEYEATEFAAEGEKLVQRQVTRTRKIVDVVPTDEVPRERLAAIAAIKQGRNGIELKLHDQVKALELLGRHLGIFEIDNKQKAPETKPMTAEQFAAVVSALNGKK